ncbi:enoyl-CoA hydratase-related protein [Marinomonas sp. 15G1-11]|uniref:Enoyl-CoA hydratase-related protein n=1 Tax=Marinomonas phaeophyticola TaxID=3004091 RepID=A0ABT4JZ98_9GAMM|nr:enoyl-CoA hydratase-related protein [Marinomonas sp. 15G1-11]MCZ2723710.1 enoyl-CoA hydratase-related protein [Marinomonas sp. 15G1-11]
MTTTNPEQPMNPSLSAAEKDSLVKLHYSQEGVAELILNRPEKHNAFDDTIIQLMLEKLELAEKNAGTQILVLRSNGKHFSAGADLSWMKRMAANSHSDNIEDAANLAKLMGVLNNFSHPTLALIQGATYGGAVGLAACCDIVLAQDNARFCLSEVKIGLTPATISPYVIRAIGERQARRFFLTAEVINATDALHMGLVHKLVSSYEELTESADAMIQQLKQNSPKAVTAAKELILNVSQKDISAELIQHTIECIADIRVSNEGQEGLSAFLNKRRPSWVSEEK